ncbi:aldo/keto reductase [Microbacterium sp.]|jgi:aryl-alcohol dehydrogenase-like predicted oxidoreductase|uniref:aldo/keto reductase n=1 Tax=Microbacterium sp. TaxID=51671 RepID=UPI0037C9B352
MRYVTLPAVPVQASVIGLGTMIFHTDTQDRDFALLDAFVDGGGTYIDTAEIYGAVEQFGLSEIVIGRWLQERPGMRDKIVLGSKGLIPGTCEQLHPGGAQITPEGIDQAIPGSLERLQTDRLDIWMFHRDNADLPVGPLVEALDRHVKAGRILSYGASNWSTERIDEAIRYAEENSLTPMQSASPQFSLAKAKEPYWPETVVTTGDDQKWFARRNMPLVAWSALGRGFFALANPDDLSDKDLVRVFYNDDNFARKQRAEELGRRKGLSMFEVALAYVTSQSFPVIALNGAATTDEIATSLKAGDLELSDTERDWLDLHTDTQPFN